MRQQIRDIKWISTTVNTKEIQRTLQRASEKGGLDLVFEEWKKKQKLDSQRKEVRESFCRKKTHLRTGIKEGKPVNEFVKVNGSIHHKVKWVWMARLWPSHWEAEVPRAHPAYMFMHMAAGALMICMVEKQVCKITSEAVLSIHTDEQRGFH